ncbi:hypothetical protein G6F46_000376 [Rhizopus delemar]|nr:hypothetical protein G6F55_003066 [Rhizopus delemar]KAG1553657.1 hypothetical protein G6F51_000457 [Rhizopus arrhizus]KAG1504350.1 hypothetical protein G6F54_001068 [Rhizopus delemar]KAG1518921.1 hypothetical protein G6F53_000196 [Rhizopus delemar]KAG1519448.1 hypothetical protein G6F52_008611 [Rhizopus delemar]
METAEEEKKRELSTPTTSDTAKRPRLPSFGDRKVKHSILSDDSDEEGHEPMISLSAYNLDDDEDDDDEEALIEQYSLSGRPARRSILSELLSSVIQDENSLGKRRRSYNSSALGIQGGTIEEEDEDEDEKTTLPITRSLSNKPPADEVDAFFTSTASTDRLEYAKLRQQPSLSQKNTPPFITNWPHFITEEFFKQHTPQDRAIECDEKVKVSSTGYFDTEFSKGPKIGSGEHADVYFTRRQSTGEVCATKKSKSPFTGWEDRWLQLIEVENLLRVKFSKHCVNIIRAWEEQGYLYIQTELCNSGNLEEYLNFKNREIPEQVVWKIFYETVIGINDIHKENVVHLDLKPSNILIDNYGFIKIADFGVSIQTPANMRWVKGEGDRKYMAPELLREDFDKAADIYSLGMLLLELATGLRLPEKGEPWEIIRFGEFGDQEAALSELSPELNNLIKQLLTRDPSARPTAQDLMKSPEFLRIHEMQQGEDEESSLLGYIREKEKVASEVAKAHVDQDIFSTPQSRIIGELYSSPM